MKKTAFSLIEAMIILLLISVAIMALIPLITKQSTQLGWKAHLNNTNGAIDYLFFSDKSNSKLGIGVTTPYSISGDDPKGKVVTRTAWINSTSDIFKPNMLGVAVCQSGDINKRGIFIRSQTHAGTPTACTENNIQINNNTTDSAAAIAHHSDFTWNSATETLTIYSGNGIKAGAAAPIPVISIATGATGENTFSINSPNGTNILDYNGSTLSTGAGNTVNIGSLGDLKTLTVTQSDLTDDANLYQLDGSSPPQCVPVSPTPELTACTSSTAYYYDSACSKQVSCDGNNWVCSGSEGKITYNTEARSECDNASKPANSGTGLVYNPIAAPSDRRLKHIISDYNKGINEVSTLRTFNFTYKSDKKQQLFVGIIAQKLLGIFDEAIHMDDKGYLSYEKTPILYAMVNSVKDIFNHQYDLSIKQKKLNRKADKLLKKYEKRNS